MSMGRSPPRVCPSASPARSTSPAGRSRSGTLTCTVAFNITNTCTFTGNFAVTTLDCTISNGSTVTIVHDITVTGTLTCSTTTTTLNGAFNWKVASLTTTGNTAGTSTIVFNGTGTWTGAAGSLANSATINTAGTLTISGTVLYTTGTLTYTAGTVTTTSSTLSVASGTLTTAGVTWNHLTLTGTAVTLGSALTCTGTLTLPNSAMTFSGAYNITCGTLSQTGITATRIVTFVHGTTVTITTGIVASHSAAQTVRFTWRSDSVGNTLSFTLGPGATQDLGFVDPTDLDASGGQTLFTYHGSISNSLNWSGGSVGGFGSVEPILEIGI